jgi:hypothetical protein
MRHFGTNKEQTDTSNGVPMPDALDRLATRKRAGANNHAADLAAAIIEDCGGDPYAAVLAMVRINHALMMELRNFVEMPLHSLAGQRQQ